MLERIESRAPRAGVAGDLADRAEEAGDLGIGSVALTKSDIDTQLAARDHQT